MSTPNTKSGGSVTNYFACTLSEAAERSLCNLSDLITINDFIDHQAERFPHNVAVAFPIPSANTLGWASHLLTFKDLRNRSVTVASSLIDEFPVLQTPESHEEICVALLCPSSLDFLLIWLALIRCGFSVLLVAPQCTPEAIAGLCESCNVTTLLHHSMYGDLASEAQSKSNSRLKAIQFYGPSIGVSSSDPEKEYIRSLAGIPSSAHVGRQGTAYIFHTSGTSTGIPSPIRQSHEAAFAVLPVLDGSQHATFTTTPLYHGGIADCFRAWTSGALIWLFPGGDVPITTQNILSSTEAATDAVLKVPTAPIRYFSCVPFVLQMLSEDGSGLEMLRTMEIVGVGGAALNKTLGDRLVKEGVHLISRFGSAECGFLLSSNRDFKADTDWDYLRDDLQSKLLRFEERQEDSGLSELIVESSWPYLATTNREDGGFATSDLFEPHPTIRNAWRYHSRRDGQITLNTGKKFDPIPLEEEISACSPVVREAVVFGNGRPNPGVLILLSLLPMEREAEATNDAHDDIWRLVEAIIAKYSSHVRMFRDHVLFVKTEALLPRSSKGTLMRGIVEETYADAIDSVYHQRTPLRETTMQAHSNLSYEETKDLVRDAVGQVLKDGQELNDEDDFYAHGVDSIMCTRVRAALEQSVAAMLQEGDTLLPWNVVYDCGNITNLSKFIANMGEADSERESNIENEMIRMAQKFSALEVVAHPVAPQQVTRSDGITVVLTGATGALGAYILDILRNDASIERIICLVRAGDYHEARGRVSKSLVDRGMLSLSSSPRVACYQYFNDRPQLGLSYEAYGQILSTMTHVIHAAWDVNFSLPLRSFDPHFSGLQNLLQLASSAPNPVVFSFCSSVASIMLKNQETGRPIEETLAATPFDSSPTGYGRSKWVAEAICVSTAGMHAIFDRLRLKILRLGQLTGDSKTGSWNRSEAWPRMLSTVDILDCLPSIDQPLEWLPLDTAARAVLETTFAENVKGGECEVYHLVQYRREKGWMDLLGWIKEVREKSFEVVTPEVWLERLEKYPEEHGAKALMELWRGAYGKSAKKQKEPMFDVEETKRISPTMRNLQPISEEHGKLIWKWLNY